MANPMDKRELEIRKKVGAILFTIAGLCIVAIIAITLMSPDSFKTKNTGVTPNTPTNTQATESTVHYEKVDLQTMLDELDTNALRAEETYQDKYIEITGEITLFDSDGKYIGIEPCNALGWRLSNVTCYLTDPTHKAFLLEKVVGDVVTIKGKVSSVGEVLGYSVKIIEISD